MADQSQARRRAIAEQVGQAALNSAGGILDHAYVKEGMRVAPKAIRWTVKGVGLAPGIIYDGVKFAHSRNPRDFATGVGGLVGGIVGGGAGGGVAAPVTAPIGAAAGSWAAGELYDTWFDHERRKREKTSRWMEHRNAQLKQR